MKSELKIFDNPKFGQIRTYIEPDGSILFCGSDAAKALKYQNPTKALNDHCKHAVKRRANDSLGRQQEMTFIPESDIYRLTAKSELPGADEFERWIFDEVLPSIRKHGMYAIDDLLDNPDLLIEAAMKIKEERRRRLIAEMEKKALEDELDRSKEWYSIKRVAAINGVSWKTFKWRALKQASEQAGIPARKIFDANYGEVNVYHAKVWELLYPDYEL